jgi:hypothetical protein
LAFQSKSEDQHKERIIHNLQEAHNKLDRLQSSMAQPIALQLQYATPIQRPEDSPTQHSSPCTPGNHIVRKFRLDPKTMIVKRMSQHILFPSYKTTLLDSINSTER